MSENNSKPAPALLITARDVAERAGVSQSAVSRAFTPGTSISARMRQKVERAAQELGYRPNVLARSLSTGRSKIVGLVGGNVENMVFTLVVDALSTRLTAEGYRLLLFTAPINARVDQQIEELLNYRVDAIVLLSARISPRLTAECQKAGIPVILFNRPARRAGGTYSVTGDNEGGGRAIARHVIERGYTRPAFMAGYEDSTTSQMREAGFVRHLVEAGRAPPMRAVGLFTQAGAAAAAQDLLSRRDRPDAIFCANDHMAMVTVDVARYAFGLEPGRDIGILGFDDIPMAAWPSFSLTTYTQPVDAMAEAAVRFITRLEDRPKVKSATVPGQLIRRGSTR